MRNLLYSLCFCISIFTAQAQTERITVDAGQLQDTSVALMQGFINGGNQYNIPLTQELRPQFWGFGWDVVTDYDYTTPNFSLTIMASIYSAYMSYHGIGDPMQLQPWTDGYVQWDGFISAMVNQSISNNRPVDFWSVWGEPDASFSGTPAQYIEIFRRTDSIVHSIDPAAKLVGPDYISYGIVKLLFFIDTLHTLNMHPAAFSWHEFGDYPEYITDHVQQFRDSLAVRPFTGNPQIHIQEYADPDNRQIPGWALGWLYYFEQAEVDWASRGCFDENDGSAAWDDCWNGLSGMYMQDGATPQALYWVHRAYAGLHAPQRIQVIPQLPHTIGLASRNDQNQEIKIIAGRYYSPLQGQPSAPADVQVIIRHYPYGNNSIVPFIIQRIPAPAVSYSIPLTAPVTVYSGNMQLTADSATITLPSFADGDVYIIYLNPDTAGLLADEPAEDAVDEMHIHVFPNPASDQLTITSDDALLEKLILTDITGRTVYRYAGAPAPSVVIPVSACADGLYTLMLTGSDGHLYSRKVHIRHGSP